MRAILVIGWKSNTSEPEGLYCGLDGAKAMAIAEKARNTSRFFALRFISQVETVGRPLPVVPEAKSTPAKQPQAPKQQTPKATADNGEKLEKSLTKDNDNE